MGEVNLKKEKIVWIILFIIVGAFIYLMPQINAYLTDKRNNKNTVKPKTEQKTTKIETKKVVSKTTKYSCTKAIVLDKTLNADITKDAVFTINSKENVESYILNNTYSFKAKANYDLKKAEVVKAVTGIEYVPSFDDKNLTVLEKITVSVSKIKNTSSLDYPIEKDKLETLLKTDGYTCSYLK